MNPIGLSICVFHRTTNGPRPPSPFALNSKLSILQSQTLLPFSIPLHTTTVNVLLYLYALRWFDIWIPTNFIIQITIYINWCQKFLGWSQVTKKFMKTWKTLFFYKFGKNIKGTGWGRRSVKKFLRIKENHLSINLWF